MKYYKDESDRDWEGKKPSSAKLSLNSNYFKEEHPVPFI
jgi:hypothetical protein